MYEVQFYATTAADWAQAIELIDANTNRALDIPDEAEFTLAIGGREWPCGNVGGSTDNGIITRQGNVIQWRFSPPQLTRFWAPGTFPVGLTMTTDAGTVQLLVGTLAIIDGVIR